MASREKDILKAMRRDIEKMDFKIILQNPSRRAGMLPSSPDAQRIIAMDYADIEKRMLAFYTAQGYDLETVIMDEFHFRKQRLHKRLWKRFLACLSRPATKPARKGD